MIPADVIDTIQDVRFHAESARERLQALASVRSLAASSDLLATALRRLSEALDHPLMSTPCDGRVRCAVIGSSGHGKTTLLDEMFPSLSRRGWLVTDVTDTTAQALRIACAEPDDPEADAVTVRSSTVAELKELLSADAVLAEHEKDHIKVRWLAEGVEIDGRELKAEGGTAAELRFGRTIRLEPFQKPWRVPPEKAKDRGFIRALTVKEQSEVLDSGPLFSTEGRSYDALQLRALVKDVALKDDFEQLARWAEGGLEAVRTLEIIDTPGLAVQGSAKDEILRHLLERKSLQLALDLWRSGEIDLVVHLVLNGRQSDFATFWKEIERTCGQGATDELEERLILAVNGANVWFTNRDVKAKYEDQETTRREGDHFQTTLEDNILQKMSPRGRVRPARVVFLDSRSIVETMTTGSYADAYARYRPIMERWIAPGGPGRATLERLGLYDAFVRNMNALCDPEDRGQGALLRAILDLGAERGPKILLDKYLRRTGLLEGLKEVREAMARFYDEQGRLNQEGARTALRACLAFIADDHQALERFAKEAIDPRVPEVIPRTEKDPNGWPARAFAGLLELLRDAVLQRAEASAEASAAFASHLAAMQPIWSKRFGWDDAVLAPPNLGFANSVALVRHSLCLHAREILFELSQGGETSAAPAEQGESDRLGVVEVLRMLDTATSSARGILREVGGLR